MQNPFSDSFGFKNPILDFFKETHPKFMLQCLIFLHYNSITVKISVGCREDRGMARSFHVVLFFSIPLTKMTIVLSFILSVNGKAIPFFFSV